MSGMCQVARTGPPALRTVGRGSPKTRSPGILALAEGFAGTSFLGLGVAFLPPPMRPRPTTEPLPGGLYCSPGLR